ncbi:hypothetical protein [Xanthocytophaga flava]|uniref:hypothetical protein n=1 Tax=Xanthocytophaga flava TaxID=3048013 RepID=UPI0028D2B9EA|nr:hypothetical protein [Xanthocytophaga flavus]MDJ1466950.1 hypothetical protein [Xanthocytophaga flavus]
MSNAVKFNSFLLFQMIDSFTNLPQTIVSPLAIDTPNQAITLYQSEFILQQDQYTSTVNGTISLNWFPRPGVIFKGIVQTNLKDVFLMMQSSKGLEVVVDGLVVSKAILTNHSSSESSTLAGKCIGEMILNDKSVSVDKVRFVVPNLRDFHGEVTQSLLDSGKLKAFNSRLYFENNSFEIVLDKSPQFPVIKKLLESQGGYAILYSGEIIKKKGAINYQDAQDLISCFSRFLAFLNGRRTSPILLEGIFDEEVKWTEVSPRIIDQYTHYVPSWPTQHSTTGLNELWQNFSKLWAEEEDFIVTALHWYVEANGNSGFVEGSIVMAQTALELIYNWLIIEKKRMIIGQDAETLSAANKIRLILSQLKISPQVPIALSSLQSYVSSEKLEDGVEAFVQIRNAIIHSQSKKRKTLAEISNNAKYEALQMALWYIEVSLLYIFSYKDKYFNRCSGEQWAGQGEEVVPYI